MKVYTDDHFNVRNEGDELSINNILEEHSGDYECTVNYKEKPQSVIHKVIILAAPSVKVDSHIKVEEGSKVEINCTASGSPMPDVSWRLNNESVEISKGKTLTIPSVRPEDNNVYTCQASNSEGVDTKDVKLIVLCT